jgi:hypothetical protein
MRVRPALIPAVNMPHLVSASGIGPTAVPGAGKDFHSRTFRTAMPHYRLYVTTADGHVTAPVIECADDQEAIGKAAQLVDGQAVETVGGGAPHNALSKRCIRLGGANEVSTLQRRRRPTPTRISIRPRGSEASTIWSTIWVNRSAQVGSHLAAQIARYKVGAENRLHYSLHGVATRPARVGDKLVTTQFCNTTTRGFSAVEEPKVAVCLLPGTEIAFEKKVERHLTGFQLLFGRTRQLPDLARRVHRG